MGMNQEPCKNCGGSTIEPGRYVVNCPDCSTQEPQTEWYIDHNGHLVVDCNGKTFSFDNARQIDEPDEPDCSTQEQDSKADAIDVDYWFALSEAVNKALWERPADIPSGMAIRDDMKKVIEYIAKRFYKAGKAEGHRQGLVDAECKILEFGDSLDFEDNRAFCQGLSRIIAALQTNPPEGKQ